MPINGITYSICGPIWYGNGSPCDDMAGPQYDDCCQMRCRRSITSIYFLVALNAFVSIRYSIIRLARVCIPAWLLWSPL